MGACFSKRRAPFYTFERTQSMAVISLDALQEVKTLYNNSPCQKKNTQTFTCITIRMPILMNPKKNQLYISHTNRIKLN